MADRREYIRWYIVIIKDGVLEPVHPGTLPFISEAEQAVRDLGIVTGSRVAIIDEPTMNAYENANAQSICGCQTERVREEDEHGTYWRCPECGEDHV